MANDADIMELRAALLSLADYAEACHTKLAKYPDADRDWLLSRTPNIDLLVARVRKACIKAAGE